MLRTLVNQIANKSVITHFKPLYHSFKRKHVAKKLMNRYSIKKQSEESPNVVLIVIDCFRWDHTSNRKTTPILQNLSTEGFLFRNCYAPSSWTYPSVTSLLSGYYQHKHGGGIWTHNSPTEPREDILLLPEILSNLGYQTMLMSDIYFAIMANQKRTADFFYYHKNEINPIDLINKRTINFQENFFLNLHLGNLHVPLKLPKTFQNIFGKIDMSIDNLTSDWVYRNGDINRPAFAHFKENRIRLYDSILRFTDSMIGSIITKIKEECNNDTIFVITADHGEEFWDHVELEKKYFYSPQGHDGFGHGQVGFGHGHNLFQEIIKIPLLIFGGNLRPTTSNEAVSLIDVFPTLLELLSINHRIPVDGQSLLQPRKVNKILSEGSNIGFEKKAIIKGDHKLILSTNDDVSLLFNLKEDPMESTPLNNPELKNQLKSELPQENNIGSQQNLTKIMKERLKDLGYL